MAPWRPGPTNELDELRGKLEARCEEIDKKLKAEVKQLQACSLRQRLEARCDKIE
jgi:hypothetical protein